MKETTKLIEKPAKVTQIEESKTSEYIEPIPDQQTIIHWSKVKAEAEKEKAQKKTLEEA